MKDPKALHLVTGSRPYQRRAYIARPITALKGLDKDFVDGIVDVVERVCERNDIEIYDPETVSGTDIAPNMSEAEVYLRDSAQVLKAHVLFAICTPRCEGVPMEIQLAGLCGVPVVIIYRSKWEDQEHKISRMLLGCPARIVEKLSLQGHKGAEKTLDSIMKKVLDAIDRVRASSPTLRTNNGLGTRIQDRRMQLRMTEDDLAAQLGVATEYLKTLEGTGIWKSLPDKAVLSPEEHTQPTLRILKRLAAILDLDLDWLIRGQRPATFKDFPGQAMKTSNMEKSFKNLIQLMRSGLKWDEFTRLWGIHMEKCKSTERPEGLEVAARDLPVVEVQEWHRRLKALREGPQLFEA